MEFERRDAPFMIPTSNVSVMMRHVLYALIPAGLAYVWFFGSGFIFNLFIACVFCIAGELSAYVHTDITLCENRSTRVLELKLHPQDDEKLP